MPKVFQPLSFLRLAHQLRLPNTIIALRLPNFVGADILPASLQYFKEKRDVQNVYFGFDAAQFSFLTDDDVHKMQRLTTKNLLQQKYPDLLRGWQNFLNRQYGFKYDLNKANQEVLSSAINLLGARILYESLNHPDCKVALDNDKKFELGQQILEFTCAKPLLADLYNGAIAVFGKDRVGVRGEEGFDLEDKEIIADVFAKKAAGYGRNHNTTRALEDLSISSIPRTLTITHCDQRFLDLVFANENMQRILADKTLTSSVRGILSKSFPCKIAQPMIPNSFEEPHSLNPQEVEEINQKAESKPTSPEVVDVRNLLPGNSIKNFLEKRDGRTIKPLQRGV